MTLTYSQGHQKWSVWLTLSRYHCYESLGLIIAIYIYSVEENPVKTQAVTCRHMNMHTWPVKIIWSLCACLRVRLRVTWWIKESDCSFSYAVTDIAHVSFASLCILIFVLFESVKLPWSTEEQMIKMKMYKYLNTLSTWNDLPLPLWQKPSLDSF